MLRVTGQVLEVTRHDGADFAYHRAAILTGTDVESVKLDDKVWAGNPVPQTGDQVDIVVRVVGFMRDGATRASVSVQGIRPYVEPQHAKPLRAASGS